MAIGKMTLATISLAVFLIGCSQNKQSPESESKNSYHCYEYTIKALISGSEYTLCSSLPQKGSIKFLIPDHWTLDSTRQIEARVFHSDEGESITIGEVMNVAMSADPSEFSIISKPQDLSENIPVQGYASWSWCLKPKRSGTLYVCFEVDIKGKEFGQKILSKSIAIPIQQLPFWDGLAYFFLNNWQWLIPLGSFIIAVLAEIKSLIPTFGYRKITKKLAGLERKIDSLTTKEKG